MSMKYVDLRTFLIQIRRLVEYALRDLEDSGVLTSSLGENAAPNAISTLDTILEGIDDYQKTIPVEATNRLSG